MPEDNDKTAGDEHLKTIIRTLLRDHDWGSDDFEKLGLKDNPHPVSAVIERTRWLLDQHRNVLWHARSDLDGYFVVLFMSAPGDAEAARAKAWAMYTDDSHRPDIDAETGRPEYEGYHTDPRGLEVNELGPDWDGADGEGHVEVEATNSWPAMPCDEAHVSGATCKLPIGHGSDFPHRTEAGLEWFPAQSLNPAID